MISNASPRVLDSSGSSLPERRKADAGHLLGEEQGPVSADLTVVGWLLSLLPASYRVIGWCQVEEQ